MQQLIPRNISGFEQLDQEHNSSRQKDKKRQTNLYFQIPEAKPLLSKHHIEFSKPKVLIRQIKITKECSELTAAQFTFTAATDKPVLTDFEQYNTGELTLWKKFILSNNYRCLYLKYYTGNVEVFEGKTNKNLKHELTKFTQNNESLFATYIIDINFLSQMGSYAIRNLQETHLKDAEAKLLKMETQVQFDSRFQSGNLMYVFSKNDTQNQNQIKDFYLVLQNDVNTRGFANWFYFRFSSKKAGRFRFHIVNMQKNYSFFAHGMRPTVFSLQKYRRDKTEWHNDGFNITYHRNYMPKSQQNGMKYNSLVFTIQQPFENDLMYIAASMPYSYSRLLSYLERLDKIARLNAGIIYRRQGLAVSISSNECPVLTITGKRDKKKQDLKKRKKIVFVLARQHPSEIVSSFVMEGFINQLLQSQDQRYSDLVKRYIFKIVPMVNVDGVIYGNSRCDISGADCNRKWTRNPNSYLYPIIAAIKKLVENLIFDGYQIEYFIDLHGHSRKLGTFVYGCKGSDQVQSRMFAYLMSKISKHFSFQECRFGVSNYRKETARGCMNTILANYKSMTLQTSFYGYRQGSSLKPFETKDLHQIGASLLQTINIDTFRNSKSINWANISAEIRQTMLKVQNNQNLTDEQQSGSDSNPEVDQMPPQEKASTFLNATSIAKIGLKQVKVKQRTKKQSSQPKKIFLFDLEQSMDNYNNNNDNTLTQKYLQSEMLVPIQKHSTTLRQVKSVTKVEPFKFRSLQRKQSQSVNSKKIRIAIDIQRVQRKDQRIASPSLPKVHARGSKEFWSHFKKQYETLVQEKQKMIKLISQPCKPSMVRPLPQLKEFY